MILPVWVAAWEYECCRPEAVVGEPWTGSLFLHPPEPRRVRATEAIDADALALGLVELDVRVIRPAPHPDAASLVATDSLRLGVVGIAIRGAAERLRGRVVFEGHVGPDGVELDEVETHGVVRRVRRVPLVRELREGVWVPVRQLEPVEVRSTAERHRDGLPPTTSSETYCTDDLLVDVEVSGTP